MPSLVNWIDFSKFNKELMDDDYNHGQSFVTKVKMTSSDGKSVSLNSFNHLQECTDTLKRSVAKPDGSASLGVEAKFKATLNQNVHEATIKNSGEVIYDLKLTGATQVIHYT